METEPNDPLGRAEALYREPLNPGKTTEMERLLKQAAAETKALEAILRLCDFLNRWNRVGKADVEAAKVEIAAALAINPNLGAAHYALGFVYRTEGEHEKALTSFQRAVEIDPGNARAVAQAGAEQLYLGHPNEALTAIRRAVELDPDNPARGMFHWIEARALFFDGQYAEAIPCLEQSVALWPDLWYTQAYEISAHALTEQKETAERKLAAFIQKFPDLRTISDIVEAEKTNPNKNPFVVEGRRKFHEGLALAGMAR